MENKTKKATIQITGYMMIKRISANIIIVKDGTVKAGMVLKKCIRNGFRDIFSYAKWVDQGNNNFFAIPLLNVINYSTDSNLI